MTRLMQMLRRFRRREDGVATIEFVLTVPSILFVFFASFESGMLMTRHVMLDRAVDMVMRELRLGHYDPSSMTSDQFLTFIKGEICDRTSLIADCENVIHIYLEPIDTVTWALPTTAPACVDRAAAVNPPEEFAVGAADEIMLVQVCVVVDPLLPGTGIGLGLPKDGNGGYSLVSTSAFVNEPS